MKGIQGSLHMPSRRHIAVRGKQGMNGDEVGASRESKPTNAANETLIHFFAMLESRRGVILRRFSNGIDRSTRSIWSCRGGLCLVV
jgi:hypothetical protein